MKNRYRITTLTGVLVAVGLSGCATSDPMNESGVDGGGDSSAIVVGSQDYYSNEIVAEIYAQALESNGFEVDRQLRIGQREAYIPELESGAIDLFPEYSGPVLQYWNPDTTARSSQDVYDELSKTVPEGLTTLEQASATDQDAYVVTKEFAEKWDVKTISDLAKVKEDITLGGNSEGENRPNGPRGLKNSYDVTVDFTPIEDGGGPLTVKALEDGDIQLAIIYTADPSIKENDLVVLEDPEGLFLSSNIVPLASDDLESGAAEVINSVSKELNSSELISLNARSVNEELPAATIAQEWLAQENLG